MSATQSRSAASAVNFLSTRSGAGRADRVPAGGVKLPATTDALQALRSHQSSHPLATDSGPLRRRARHGCAERRRSLAIAGESTRSWHSVPHPLAIASRRTLSPRVVAAGGDVQHSAHRGDRVGGLIRSHELEDFSGTEPVSRANQAAAFARISRSCRSWRFSRRSRWSSFRSCVVRPSSRRPSSRSACSTQLRIVCADGSNSRPAPPAFAQLAPARPAAAATPAGTVASISAS